MTTNLMAWRGRGPGIDTCVYVEINCAGGGVFLCDMGTVAAAEELVKRINEVPER